MTSTSLQRNIARSCGKYSRKHLVASIAGLLTMPEFHGSARRLEVLQHLAVENAKGILPPFAIPLTHWINELRNDWVGQSEDPAESVFVSRVAEGHRDYLIFEGLNESSAFILEHFLRVLGRMPQEKRFTDLKNSVLAILVMSDEIVKRSSIEPFCTGNSEPFVHVSHQLVRRGIKAQDRVSFSKTDLTQLGVRQQDIEPFVLADQECADLRPLSSRHSLLERYPLISTSDKFVVSLPSAISMAIRRSVVEWCLVHRFEDNLNRVFATEIAITLSNTPVLSGDRLSFLPLKVVNNLYTSNVVEVVDERRLLHVCLIVDNFANYDESMITGLNPDSSSFNGVIETSINEVRKTHSVQTQQTEVLSLVVLGGWGLGVIPELERVRNDSWRIEAITVPDFIMLCNERSFRVLDLWTLLDTRDCLQQYGVELVNFSGLLNLYAWSNSLDGILVPPKDLAEDSFSLPITYAIRQNSHLEVRQDRLQSEDVHHVLNWEGQNVRVRRNLEHPYFQEDANSSIYVSIDHLEQQQLVAVYETDTRSWWLTIETPNCQDRNLEFHLWDMLRTWLERSVPIIESSNLRLPRGPILWSCRFYDSHRRDPKSTIPTPKQARNLLQVRTQDNKIFLRVSNGFFDTFRAEDNFGECLLLEQFLYGTCTLANEHERDKAVDSFMSKIVPDEWSRSIHRLTARDTREHFFLNVGEEPILYSKYAHALTSIGLGWSVRRREDGSRIVGVDECCNFLNQLVRHIWTEIRSSLENFNLEHLLLVLVRNHEHLRFQSRNWYTTARAVRSLHRDKVAVSNVAAKEIAKLNTSLLCTRTLIEMALCECSADSIQMAGKLDISRLFARVMDICHFGGWSDAIRYGCKEPELRVTPVGDVHSNVSFNEAIVQPYSRYHGILQYEKGARNYEQHFGAIEERDTVQDQFEPRFWDAWTDAFGFTIDDVRIFLDNLDSESERRQNVVFSATEAELVSLDGSKQLDPVVVKRIISAFALDSRSPWDSAPEGYSSKDWLPWRFRRRLSIVSKPIPVLQEDPPRYIIAPGMVRDGVRVVLDRCYFGGADARVFSAGGMRSWIGSVVNKRGHDFNKLVAERLETLGWDTNVEVKLTHILNTKLDQDYGDVDVLAWRERRVVAIECKDLEFTMGPAEIARQLHEFRGNLNDRGKPDRLLRHLNRLKVLKRNQDAVERFIGRKDLSLEGLLAFSRVVPLHFASVLETHNVRITTSDTLNEV